MTTPILENPGDDELTETFAPISFSNPKQTYGDNKVALHLVPPVLEIYGALAAWEGAEKYGAYNWREIPVEIMTYIGAIRRHLVAILDGEWMDPGYWHKGQWFPPKPHLSGIIMSAGIIADCFENGNLIDNRPAKGKANELLNQYQKHQRPGPDTPYLGNHVQVDEPGVRGCRDLGEGNCGHEAGHVPESLG